MKDKADYTEVPKLVAKQLIDKEIAELANYYFTIRYNKTEGDIKENEALSDYYHNIVEVFLQKVEDVFNVDYKLGINSFLTQDKEYSPSDAEDYFNTSRQTVYKYYNAGNLKGRKTRLWKATFKESELLKYFSKK